MTDICRVLSRHDGWLRLSTRNPGKSQDQDEYPDDGCRDPQASRYEVLYLSLILYGHRMLSLGCLGT
jgi:hypothetical protein